MRRGFTLVELLVVITIITLLATLILPYFNHARELARRTVCKNRVQNIAKACVSYMNDPGMHRRSNYRNAMPTRSSVLNWHSASSGNPSALWLLVEYQLVGRDSFLCPSAKVFRNFREPRADHTKFQSDTLSYSYLSQVKFTDGNTGAEIAVTSGLNPELKAAELAIIADANPRYRIGSSSFSSASNNPNSLNHDYAGQNVAFLDGHADWFASPIIPGTMPLKNSPTVLDNIYRSCGSSGDSGKRGAINDAFLIP